MPPSIIDDPMVPERLGRDTVVPRVLQLVGIALAAKFRASTARLAMFETQGITDTSNV